MDLRRSLVSSLVVAPERIVLPRLRDVLIDAVTLLQKREHHEQVEAMVADFDDAFHSLPIHPDEEKYCVARIAGDRFRVSKMVMFGGVASPLTWGRAATFLVGEAASIFTIFSTPCTVTTQCYGYDPSLGRDVAIYVSQVLPELLWILAIMRRAVARGEPS